jgi:hypothetical protein
MKFTNMCYTENTTEASLSEAYPKLIRNLSELCPKNEGHVFSITHNTG